jgi:hypothetical protein
MTQFVDEPDFFERVANEAERSSDFRARIDALRAKAAGEHRDRYSRSTGGLTPYSWGELVDLAASASGDGRRHVKEYLASCRAVARLRLLAAPRAVEALAERVHELVRGEGYRVNVSGLVADRPWPKDALASSVAAVVANASWGSGPTAQRQLSRRHRASMLPEDWKKWKQFIL